jgi:Ion channel
MRWSIETITTVTYEEYHPVTHSGRLIGSLIMFISIAFLWTFVGLLGSRIIANRITRNQEKNIRITDYSSKPTSVIQETKSIVERRIDEIETLGKGDLDELIALIRLLNSDKEIS